MDELFDALRQTAARKRMQQQAMRNGADPAMEKAQDVVAAVAQALADRFAGGGFKYAKSGQRRLTRKVGDWQQEIILDGGGTNTPGRRIHFNVFAFVKNAALKRWQKAKPSPLFRAEYLPSDVSVVSDRTVAGWPKTDWNLHDPKKRAAVIDAAESLVRAKILPTLAMLADRDRLCEALLRDTETDHHKRLVTLGQTIDLLLFYFEAATAAGAVDAVVAANASPQFADQLKRAFAKARAGRPPEDGRAAEFIAVAVTGYELPVTSPLLVELQTAELPAYDPLDEQRRSRAAQAELAAALRGAGFKVDADPS